MDYYYACTQVPSSDACGAHSLAAPCWAYETFSRTGCESYASEPYDKIEHKADCSAYEGKRDKVTCTNYSNTYYARKCDKWGSVGTYSEINPCQFSTCNPVQMKVVTRTVFG